MQFWENNDNDESGDGGNNRRPPQPPPNWRKWISPGLLVLVMLLALISSPGLFGGFSSTPEIAYSDVYEQLTLNNISLLHFQDSVAVSGTLKSSIIVTTAAGRMQNVSRFTAQLPPYAGAELLRMAHERGVETIDGSWTQPSTWLTLLINFLPLVLIIGFFVWMGRRAQGQMNGIFSFGQSQAREKSPEMPTMKFEDVAGQDAAKLELEEVVEQSRDTDVFGRIDIDRALEFAGDVTQFDD